MLGPGGAQGGKHSTCSWKPCGPMRILNCSCCRQVRSRKRHPASADCLHDDAHAFCFCLGCIRLRRRCVATWSVMPASWCLPPRRLHGEHYGKRDKKQKAKRNLDRIALCEPACSRLRIINRHLHTTCKKRPRHPTDAGPQQLHWGRGLGRMKPPRGLSRAETPISKRRQSQVYTALSPRKSCILPFPSW